MSDLSEERKRQIREEEEQRLRRIKEEEDAYREQVRRQLESGPVPPPAAEPAPPVEPPPAGSSHELPARERASRPRRERPPVKNRRLRIAAASVYGLAGLALAYYAYYQGFPIPGLDGPFQSTLSASADGELAPVGRGKWDRSDVAYDEWTLTDDGKVVAKPDTAKSAPVPPRVAAGERPRPSTSTVAEAATDEAPTDTGAGAAPTDPGRSSIDGGKISFRVPSGWTVTESDNVRVIITRDVGGGSQLRVILTNVTDRAGGGLEDLHAQHIQYVQDWIGGGLEIEDDFPQTLGNGLAMAVTVFVHPSDRNYYYGAFTTASNGRGLWITMDGPEDVPEEVDTELMGLFESLRLAR